MKISKKQRLPFMMVLPFSGNQFCKCSSESPSRSEKKRSNHLVCRSVSSFLRFTLRLVRLPLYVILFPFNENFYAKGSPVAFHVHRKILMI